MVDYDALSRAFVEVRAEGVEVRVVLAIARHCEGTLTEFPHREICEAAKCSQGPATRAIEAAIQHDLIVRDETHEPYRYALAVRFVCSKGDLP